MMTNLTVLVADDDPDTAASLAQVLATYGHRARAASTPLDAVRLAAADPPDVVVMDLRWPDLDGFELARAVGEVAGRPPLLVAVTGLEGAEAQSKAHGFHHHFRKPVPPDELAGVLDDYARGSGPGHSGPP